MTEALHSPGAEATSAGQMIRAARLAQGVHIAALAASIKVSVQKLEALEAERFDELPDVTFARALAQSVCRSLKIDPAPVLALLPQPATQLQLPQVSKGLNEPFVDAANAQGHGDAWGWVRRPALWGPLGLVLGALILWWVPETTWQRLSRPEQQAASGVRVEVIPVDPAASAGPAMPPTEPASVTGLSVGETVPVLPAQAVASAPTAVPDAPVVVRTTAESWVEIQDARGRVLVSRLLAPGEQIQIDGAFPMKVRIGNADGTELRLRGEVFDMAPHRRGNVARFELR